MSGLYVRDVYPDLDSYPWEWYEPVSGQKVKRYLHPKGHLIDVYDANGQTWGVKPAIVAETS